MNKRNIIMMMAAICAVFSVIAVMEGQSLYNLEKGRGYKIVYGGKALQASYNHNNGAVTFSFEAIRNVVEQRWYFPETDDHFCFVRPEAAVDRRDSRNVLSIVSKALATSPHGPIPWDIMDSDEFKWRIENAGSGKVYFFNKKTGTSLNVSGTGLVMGLKRDTAKFQLVPQ